MRAPRRALSRVGGEGEPYKEKSCSRNIYFFSGLIFTTPSAELRRRARVEVHVWAQWIHWKCDFFLLFFFRNAHLRPEKWLLFYIFHDQICFHLRQMIDENSFFERAASLSRKIKSLSLPKQYFWFVTSIWSPSALENQRLASVLKRGDCKAGVLHKKMKGRAKAEAQKSRSTIHPSIQWLPSPD